MSDLISIIIPVYNHAHVLGRVFTSIKRQTYRPLEVIVVDDGSTDNFVEVIDKIQKENHDFSLKVIKQKNSGASVARNAGFAEANGQYIIFFDADTIAKPSMLEKMKSALDKNLDVSYVYSQFCFGCKKIKSHQFDSEILKKVNYIDTTSLLRREAFTSFDEKLKRFQDWDLWLTLLEKNKIGIFLPEVLFKKIVGGRRGISSWLPSFIFKLPWRTKQVTEYEKARAIIYEKHQIKNPD